MVLSDMAASVMKRSPAITGLFYYVLFHIYIDLLNSSYMESQVTVSGSNLTVFKGMKGCPVSNDTKVK